MGTAYTSLGSKVTLISSGSGILPSLDSEAASIVQRDLESAGVQVYLSTSATKVEKAAGLVKVTLSDGRDIKGSQILVAAGRKAQTSNVGLEKPNILGDGVPIPVNDSLQVKAIPEGWLYAAGDVNGRAPLTQRIDCSRCRRPNLRGSPARCALERSVPQLAWGSGPLITIVLNFKEIN